MLLLQKYNVRISNIQLAKRQVKQVSFSHSSERQQRVQISYLRWQTVPGAHHGNREHLVAKCLYPGVLSYKLTVV